jgi:hypothetical protein
MSGVDPDDPWPEVPGWRRVAGSDQRVGRLCLGVDPPLFDVATFHCQQAAEKLLKGFQVRAGTDFRLVTALPIIRNSMVQAPTGPGLCTALRPEVKLRDDATIRLSGASPRT